MKKKVLDALSVVLLVAVISIAVGFLLSGNAESKLEQKSSTVSVQQNLEFPGVISKEQTSLEQVPYELKFFVMPNAEIKDVSLLAYNGKHGHEIKYRVSQKIGEVIDSEIKKIQENDAWKILNWSSTSYSALLDLDGAKSQVRIFYNNPELLDQNSRVVDVHIRTMSKS